ncbi:MAG: hypothetical protein FJ271_20015 [Planctomycetes bacterium]|nr:hypothetical protein [Planctomycetota bacterium]
MGRVPGIRAGLALVGMLSALVASCRHLPPETKPPKEPEMLVKPPAGDRRYDYPVYPKEAFNEKYDPRKHLNIGGHPNMPGGAGMMNPNMPGSGI